ncbi:MAG: DUF6562 domain-containing protein [Alloprevotella sp.]|nr:DUF6562 domain-containing protein [Alloprevotella sp.]
MKRERLHRLLLPLLVCLAAVAGLFTSCDVHEVPEPPSATATCLRLSFSTLLTSNDVNLLGGRAKSDSLRAVSDTLRTLRLSLRAYPLLPAGQAADVPVFSRTYLREVSPDDYDCILPAELPVGNYRLAIWADFVSAEGLDCFYDTRDFREITLQAPHTGGADLRDAFRGVVECEVQARTYVAPPDTIDVAMERPLAKIEFLTTDLKEFISKEQERAEELLKSNGATASSADADTKDSYPQSVDLSLYNIRFYYAGFMPSVYSLFDDKPIDSATGVSFDSKIRPTDQGEASLGFDYVFVNGKESFVSVIVCVYDTEGHLMVTSPTLKVPTRRNFHTLVRGKFLTETASSGITIDADFDGEFNIEVRSQPLGPLPPE